MQRRCSPPREIRIAMNLIWAKVIKINRNTIGKNICCYNFVELKEMTL